MKKKKYFFPTKLSIKVWYTIIWESPESIKRRVFSRSIVFFRTARTARTRRPVRHIWVFSRKLRSTNSRDTTSKSGSTRQLKLVHYVARMPTSLAVLSLTSMLQIQYNKYFFSPQKLLVNRRFRNRNGFLFHRNSKSLKLTFKLKT